MPAPARCRFPARDEGFKDVGSDVGRNARPVVDDLHLQGQRQAAAVLAPQPQRQIIERPQPNRAAVRPRCLGRVPDQVQEHLHQLVRIGQGGGQRGVVILDEGHVRSIAHLGRLSRPVQHVVDIHRPQIGRAHIAELFHLLQQLHDPASFLDDQIGQRAVLGAQVHCHQLRRTGNARQRVLDLMGQHLGHADRRFCGRTGAARPAQPIGQNAGRDQHQHLIGGLVQLRHLDGRLDRRPVAGRHIDIIDREPGLVGPCPHQRIVQCGIDLQARGHRLALQAARRGVEEGLGRRIGRRDPPARIHQNRRQGQRCPDGPRRWPGIARRNLFHAATLSGGGASKARASRAITRAGSFSTRISGFRPGSPPRSRYQARCFLTQRRPRSVP